MFCMHCGQRLDDGAKFCSNCGAPLDPNGHVRPASEPEPAAPLSTQPQEMAQPAQAVPAASQPVYENRYAPPAAPQPAKPHAVSATAYLVWAIIVTVLCFLPTGIPAIVFAANINRHNDAGEVELARAAAKKSRTWTIVSAVVGVVVNIVGFILLVAVAMSEF